MLMLRVVWSFLVSGLVATILLIAQSSQLLQQQQHQEAAFDAPPADALEKPFKLINNNHEGGVVFEPTVDLHNGSIAVLGLADWEIRSIEGNTDEASSIASCQPPSHVSKACCIGTYSRGGDINYKERHQCNSTTLQDYQKLQQEVARDDVSPSGGCDVCRILQICLRYNLTVAFFGDSMTNQVVQGLICELQRRNYRVNQTRIPGKQDVCKKCIKWTLLLHISSPPGQIVEMKFFFQYRYPFYYPEEELQVATSADVLILNLGLHWSWNGRMYETGRMHYRKSITDFLGFIHQHGTQQLLVYRETSAQHFDADGGDWGLRKNNASRKECVPIQSFGTPAIKWRESKVLKAAKKLGYRTMTMWNNNASSESVNANNNATTLVVLPWWDFTARHHEMHPFQECSHYCSSPFLYLPLWRGLRLAMDRKQFQEQS